MFTKQISLTSSKHIQLINLFNLNIPYYFKKTHKLYLNSNVGLNDKLKTFLRVLIVKIQKILMQHISWLNGQK